MGVAGYRRIEASMMVYVDYFSIYVSSLSYKVVTPVKVM